ncbi:MAG TPA: hypothetical protein VK902_22425 [Rubrobacter sp.]|nr:hypothetical protein [Rubrobacter sp.]
MTKPKREARGSDEVGGGLAGSGRGAAEGGEASAISDLLPLGETSVPVVSELIEKLGASGNQITPQQLSLPVYGNYCGRGHGDPTGKQPPVDAVDAVCREHNMCYGLLGDFDSRCDRNLIESMPNAIAITPTPAGKNAGLLILLYFSLAERNLALGETLFKRS